jgi:hypothetical protein
MGATKPAMSEQAALPKPPLGPPVRNQVVLPKPPLGPSPAAAHRAPNRVSAGARRIARATPKRATRTGAWVGRQVWGSLREGLVETAELEPGVRRLVVFGYVLILALFVLLYFIDIFRFAPWMAEFPYRKVGGQDPNAVFHMPILALSAAALAYLVGWAFVLTGASDCGRAVFLPAVVLFGLPLLF